MGHDGTERAAADDDDVEGMVASVARGARGACGAEQRAAESQQCSLVFRICADELSEHVDGLVVLAVAVQPAGEPRAFLDARVVLGVEAQLIERRRFVEEVPGERAELGVVDLDRQEVRDLTERHHDDHVPDVAGAASRSVDEHPERERGLQCEQNLRPWPVRKFYPGPYRRFTRTV